jgi:hypothetical protein
MCLTLLIQADATNRQAVALEGQSSGSAWPHIVLCGDRRQSPDYDLVSAIGIALIHDFSLPLQHVALHADRQGTSLRVKPNQEIGIGKSMKHFVKRVLWLLSRSYRHRLIVRRVS